MVKRLFYSFLVIGLSIGMFVVVPAQQVAALGTDRYVAKTGVDIGLCDNPSSPCLNIAYAIQVSGTVSTDVIHIAAGSYFEHLNVDRSITLAGAGITSTIIDGSSSGLVVLVQSGKNLTISDLTIQNGNNPSGSGGGMSLLLGHLILNRVRILNSHAYSGGGIYNDSANLDFRDVEISGNSADFKGGGIFNLSGSVYLTNVTLGSNSSMYGGGIYNQDNGELNLTNVTISNNTALEGGALALQVLYDGFTNTTTIVNSTIVYNHIIANPSASTGGIARIGATMPYVAVTLVNSIVAKNDDKDCGYSHIITATTSYGSNIDGDGTCLVSGIALPSDHPNTDPLLGSLAYNGGYVPTLRPQMGSSAIDAGDFNYCPLTDANWKTRPQDGNGDSVAVCDIGASESPSLRKFLSVGTYDGWILESNETSGVGGTKNNRASTLFLGDDVANKQYRSILSFNTAGIPTGATITKVSLRVKKSGVVGGGNPLNTFKGLLVEIKKGNFGKASLALGDFKATSSKTCGPFKPALSGGWYSIDLTSGQGYINRSGNTQMRLRFKLDDNNNSVANYLKLYSGNAGASASPQLIVEYYIP